MTDYKLDQSAKYSKTHEWVRIEEGIAIVGISDAAQDLLSDVVFVELPEIGAIVSAGEQVSVVESVKAAEDVHAPISGEIVETNEELDSAPEIVNEKPYEAWFFKIKPGDDLQSELDSLMTPEEYDAQVEAESD